MDSPSFPGNFYWRAYVHREQAAVALSLRGDDTPDCARISDHGVTPDGGALSPDVPKRRDGVARRSRLGYARCPGRTTPELCGPRASASDATSSQPSRPTPRWRWTPLSEFVSFSFPSSAPFPRPGNPSKAADPSHIGLFKFPGPFLLPRQNESQWTEH